MRADGTLAEDVAIDEGVGEGRCTASGNEAVCCIVDSKYVVSVA